MLVDVFFRWHHEISFSELLWDSVYIALADSRRRNIFNYFVTVIGIILQNGNI